MENLSVSGAALMIVISAIPGAAEPVTVGWMAGSGGAPTQGALPRVSLSRLRNEAICPRVTVLSGEKVVAVVPVVTPTCLAQATAAA